MIDSKGLKEAANLLMTLSNDVEGTESSAYKIAARRLYRLAEQWENEEAQV